MRVREEQLAGTDMALLNNPRVRSLVYWDNPRDSGVVCGSVLVCLLAVRYISLISVIGNLSLALVTATMSFRIYKSVLAAVNKTQEGHPFKALLEIDLRIPDSQGGKEMPFNFCSSLRKSGRDS